MGKLNDLMAAVGNHVDESMGRGASPGSNPTPAAGVPARWAGVARAKDVVLIPPDRIDRDPGQPREEFDEESLQRLAESLKTRGQLQPIRVRWDEDRGVYVVIAGERRWRAARMAGIATLAAVVVEGAIDPAELLAVQLVENALREDLQPVEQARAYRRLMDTKGWSTRHLAAELAVSQAAVVKALALLELPEPVQDRVDRGELSAAAAYQIARAPASLQAELAEAVVAEGLGRDEVAEVVQAVRARRPAAPRRRPEPIRYDLDGGSVTIRWTRADGPSAAKMLRLALDRARADDTSRQAG